MDEAQSTAVAGPGAPAGDLASDEPYRLGKIVGSAVAAAARLPTEAPSPTSTGRLNIRDKTHGVAAHPLTKNVALQMWAARHNFGWDVLVVSDNSFKGKARRRQKATGSSYMRARREVDGRRGAGGPGTVPDSADAAQLFSLLGLGDAGVDDIAAVWAARALPAGTDDPVNLGPLLRVPLGLGAGGVPVWLDLKEKADGGAGPHLLLVGRPGSGKSTVLWSTLAGLCAQHSPDLLQLILVDARKPREFDRFADYPHTAAILRRDEGVAALTELLDQRECALAAAGADSFSRYRALRARAEGADLPALPTVVVVADEFTELQRSVAGFADVLDRLIRTARTLGIHLIAVGQHAGVGVGSSGSVLTITSRIALQTDNAADSQQVVGNADAAELPLGVGMYWMRGVEAQHFRGFLLPPDLVSDLGRRFAAAATPSE